MTKNIGGVPSGTTIFIVDTEQFAGNFVHEMCAYITGRVGDNMQGDKFAQMYEEETNKHPLSNVVDVLNHNYHSPCSVWATPGWFNNGMGGVFKRGQEQAAIQHYHEQANLHYRNLIRQKISLLQEIEGNRSIDDLRKRALYEEIKRHENQIKVVSATKQIRIYPAYLSVAIFFRPEPEPIEQIFLKLRALKFAENAMIFDNCRNKPISVTGFRLLAAKAVKSIG